MGVMEYRTLGRSGCAVSSLCLGTMTFGAEADESVSHAQLDRFAEAGGTFVDTADVYSAGESERIIGKWFASRDAGTTEPIVLATKGRFPMGDGPNDHGLSRTHLTRALDSSLRRLGVEAVDLYQAHAWDPVTPIEETLRFYDDAVRAGKIRYAGVSNFLGWQLQKAATTTALRGLAPIVTLQPQYNLITRDIEFELVDVCRNEGIGILPWSPLAGGWLTGKYRRDEAPTGATRLGEDPERGMEAYAPRNAQDRTWRGRGPGRLDGAGGAGLGRRPPGGDLGHPRRPYGRAARRQPRRGRPAPVGGGDHAPRRGERAARRGVGLPVRGARRRPAVPYVLTAGERAGPSNPRFRRIGVIPVVHFPGVSESDQDGFPHR
jgi:aryl-alcohol dehydrogenase-like predicted oxidoreductase